MKADEEDIPADELLLKSVNSTKKAKTAEKEAKKISKEEIDNLVEIALKIYTEKPEDISPEFKEVFQTLHEASKKIDNTSSRIKNASKMTEIMIKEFGDSISPELIEQFKEFAKERTASKN